MKKHLMLCVSISMLLLSNAVCAQTIGSVNVDKLNVRSVPQYDGKVIDQVMKGQQLQILEDASKNQGWYKISLTSGSVAYVKEEYLTIQQISGKVNTEGLNVRSYPDLVQSQVLAQMPLGTEINILYKVGSFYKMEYKGMMGFVYAPYVDVPLSSLVQEQNIESVNDIVLSGQDSWANHTVDFENLEVVMQSATSFKDLSVVEKEPINESLGEAISEYAMQFLGNPYIYGGNDLITGVDCSGFTQQVLKAFNISIPRTSKDQSLIGTAVEMGSIQKGDLLFFGGSREAISHVGIYIGEGKMIHASTPTTGIIISSINLSSHMPLQVIKRITF